MSDTVTASLWILLGGLVAACSNASAPPSPAGAGATPDYVVHTVQNAAVDPAISDGSGVSYAGIDAGATQRGALIVFLGGTGSAPSGYQLFSKAALREGYHVVDLDYLDQTTVGSLCLDDLACYGKVRQEMVEGVDSSSIVQVSRADGILSRMAKTLTYLAGAYPGDGWSQYASGGQVAWSRVVMAGFSQGAGHALWIAKHYPTNGVILFSGPVDGRVHAPSESAQWISDPSAWATPRADFRFFISTHDGYYSAIRANLITLGFDPASVGVSVDAGVPSSPGVQLLLTSAVTVNAHPSVLSDADTPRNADGSAVYGPVWDYLLESW